MNSFDMVNKWETSNSIQDIESVAGAPMVDDQLLQQVQGGVGRGWVYTVSAECMGGIRCDFWNW